MTIPSIGGSGNSQNNIKIISNSNFQQIDTNEQVNSIKQDLNTHIEANDSSVNSDSDENEYSVNQFRSDYLKLVYDKVIPVLAGYEDERKKRLLFAVIGTVFFCIVAVLLFLYGPDSRGTGDLISLCFAAAGGVWFWIKKSFEKKIKKKIMPVLMQAIRGFYWSETTSISELEIKECKIIPYADKVSYTYDDCFSGKYRDVPISISECKCLLGSGKNSKTILEGVVVKLKMNKNFEGMTVIRPKNVSYRANYDDLKRASMSEVDLEDPIFTKKFKVYSTDQVEARYLITTAFMERFNQIGLAFSASSIYCSFHGDSVYIAPHAGKDLFNLCSLVKPITDTKQFDILFDEFASILALVDHFKLDKKLGL